MALALLNTPNLSGPIGRFGGGNTGIPQSDSLFQFSDRDDLNKALAVMIGGNNAWCRHQNGQPDVALAMEIEALRKDKEVVVTLPWVFNMS